VVKAQAAIFDFRDAQRNAETPNLPTASCFHSTPLPLGTRQK
jgi:hypothetical protein